MGTVPININKGPYRNTDNTTNKDIDRMINCYVDETGAVNKMWGLSLLADMGTYAAIDGMYYWQDKGITIVVSAGRIFKITDKSGTFTEITGDRLLIGIPVSFDCNKDYLLMANGGRMVYTDGTTTAYIPDATAPTSVTHVRYMDTYFIANETGTYNFHVSDSNSIVFSGTVLQKTTRPDNIVALEVLNDELYVIGSQSTEIWHVSAILAPLAFYMVIERGCMAPYSIVKANFTLYWLDNTKRIIALVNRTPQMMCVPYDLDIQGFTSYTDCIGSLVEVNGRPLLMWSFHEQGETIIFDLMLSFGYNRYSWDEDNSEYVGYLCNQHVWVPDYSVHWFGSRIDGKLYIGDMSFPDEGGLPLRALIRSGNLDFGTLKSKVMSRLQIWCKMGYGASDAPTPTLMMRFSDDAGTTWTDYTTIDLKLVGNTFLVADVFGLGMFYTRQFEFILTDSVPLVITKIQAEVKVGR